MFYLRSSLSRRRCWRCCECWKFQNLPASHFSQHRPPFQNAGQSCFRISEYLTGRDSDSVSEWVSEWVTQNIFCKRHFSLYKNLYKNPGYCKPTFYLNWIELNFELTVSDFCNSSRSSGRRQRVELREPSHSGRDIALCIFNSGICIFF